MLTLMGTIRILLERQRQQGDSDRTECKADSVIKMQQQVPSSSVTAQQGQGASWQQQDLTPLRGKPPVDLRTFLSWWYCGADYSLVSKIISSF